MSDTDDERPDQAAPTFTVPVAGDWLLSSTAPPKLIKSPAVVWCDETWKRRCGTCGHWQMAVTPFLGVDEHICLTDVGMVLVVWRATVID